jgi:tetratricopeptide (TPR) repeat protein
MQLAQLLMERKGDAARLSEAVSLMEESMRLARKSAQVHYVLGLAYSAAGRHEEAALALRHAVDLEPGDGRPYFPLSQSLAALGRKNEAAAHMATYKQYRDYLEAQEVLAARARRAPEDTAVIERLAAFYERVGAADNAVEQYEKLARRAPRRADYQRRLAALYGEIGRLADQRRAEDRAARLLAAAPSGSAAGP